MNKRLYKSSADKVLAGVCGGVAEYFDIDPVIVRLIWVLATLLYGVGLIFYIIAAIIIPKDYEGGIIHEREGSYDSDKGKKILGISFVVFGSLFLLKRYLYWLDGEMLIAGGFILFGVFLFLKNRGEDHEE